MDGQDQVDGVRIWAVVEMRCQLIRNAVMDQSVKGKVGTRSLNFNDTKGGLTKPLSSR
jgi:hypothetical protein